MPADVRVHIYMHTILTLAHVQTHINSSRSNAGWPGSNSAQLTSQKIS